MNDLALSGGDAASPCGKLPGIADPAHTLPPACAARYRPEKLLASGGFGAVYLARQVELDRAVALKILRPEALADAEQVRRFHREARLTAGLEHPGIVKLYDHGVDDGVPWIAYELVEGGSLRERLAAGLTVAEVIDVGIQLVDALGAAHAAGVIHRDMKPENVLVDGAGRCKITDFGIARRSLDRSWQTASGVIMGTPGYIAPETIRGDSAASADLYAVGIMLFEMIAGEPPCPAGDQLAALRWHLAPGRPRLRDRVPGVPAPVAALVEKAIAARVEDRFGTAAELGDALRAVPAGRGRVRAAAAKVPSARRGGAATTVIAPAPAAAARAPVAALCLASVALIGVALALHAREPSGRVLPPPAPSAPPSVRAPEPPRQRPRDQRLEELLASIQQPVELENLRGVTLPVTLDLVLPPPPQGGYEVSLALEPPRATLDVRLDGAAARPVAVTDGRGSIAVPCAGGRARLALSGAARAKLRSVTVIPHGALSRLEAQPDPVLERRPGRAGDLEAAAEVDFDKWAWSSAATKLEEVLRLDPGWLYARARLAEVERHRPNCPRALDLMLACVKERPGSPQLWRDLSAVLRDTGRFQEARLLAVHTLRLHDVGGATRDLYWSWLYLAQAEQSLKDPKAVFDLERAYRLNSRGKDAVFALVKIYRKTDLTRARKIVFDYRAELDDALELQDVLNGVETR